MTDDDESEGDSSIHGVPTLGEWARNQAWLADVDRDRAEEKFDRLAGDRDLASALHDVGFQGRNYDLFANEIAKYGWAVIRGWIYKNQIRGEVKRKGFGALEPEPRPGATVEDAEGLADETVVLALTAFRDKVLIPGMWDPAKRASLRTFFVGQCLMQFSNVYKRWRREELRSYAEPQAPPTTSDWTEEFLKQPVYAAGPRRQPPGSHQGRAASSLREDHRRAGPLSFLPERHARVHPRPDRRETRHDRESSGVGNSSSTPASTTERGVRMSNQFQGKIERSSFGTQSAKAARSSVSASKAQSLVSRSAASTQPKKQSGREGK